MLFHPLRLCMSPTAIVSRGKFVFWRQLTKEAVRTKTQLAANKTKKVPPIARIVPKPFSRHVVELK